MKKWFLMHMTVPIMALSILPLAGGILAAWLVHQSQKSASDALARNVSSMRAAEELVIAFHDVRAQLHLFLLTENPKYLEDVAGLRQKTDHWLDLMERTALAENEQKLIARAEQGYHLFFNEFNTIFKNVSAQRRLTSRLSELADDTLVHEILRPAQDYLDLNEREIDAGNAENERLAGRTVMGLLLLGICGPASGLLAGFGISRAISYSIVRLSVPIRDAAGKLDEIVGPITLSGRWNLDELERILRTIADRIGAVIERLQQSERNARRSEHLAAVGQLAAGLAHELRNPLMPMKILVQAAAERIPSPGLDERDLIVLEQEITRLERSIQMFLDFARPPLVEKRVFDIGETIFKLICLLAPRAELQGVRLSFQQPDQPVLIRADIGQIRQVMFNLLLNALDATPRGGTVLLEMEFAPCPSKKGGKEDRWLILRVSDTGCGLPADLGQRIFEPFVSTKETGMGLGLSICMRIIEAHEGEIQAADRPLGGAVFTVRLPCREHETRTEG